MIIKKFKEQCIGLLALTFLILSTCALFIPIFFLGILKVFPNKKWRILMTLCIDAIIKCWCATNNAYIDLNHKTSFKIEGLHELNLKRDDWYLVIANHQSWLDIVLLQRIFYRNIPMLKFFIKDQLKWIPLLGFSWWAMGSPFMKRYSKEYLLRKPHKKGQDLKATQKALEIFKETPSSIMNFIEGTRFTSAKRTLQQSPYDNLLKPKAGGVGFVISAMCDKIQHILDVTIVYPDKNHSLWDFLCQRIHNIHATVRALPIPEQFMTESLMEDSHLQIEFRSWLNELWAKKDSLMKEIARNQTQNQTQTQTQTQAQ